MLKLSHSLTALLLYLSAPLFGRDVLLEFKAAYFLPTNSVFKEIYHHGSAVYGPELTVQLCNNKNWYGFLSIDYFQKKGLSVGLSDPTKVSLLPLGVGLKYFVPLGSDRADFYFGLGFQPVWVHTKDYQLDATVTQSKWGFGGIAKVGSCVYLPHNFFIDFFIDYSFVKVGLNNDAAVTVPSIPTKANVSGALFGAGIGYRF